MQCAQNMTFATILNTILTYSLINTFFPSNANP